MFNIRQGKVIYEAIYEGVGPPSSNCSLGSRIFYLLFFQSELVAYWVKIEFGAHQKRPYDIVSNRTVQTSRCSLSSSNSHSAGMAAFRIDLSSVQQKQRFKSSYCSFFHLPSVSYIFQCSWTHSSLLFPQARDDPLGHTDFTSLGPTRGR